mmetsp:Transcript_6247/g.9349  ORF Transcript_6247/g.9349 Transcript_6247/m.9349 type:complete len:124 (+) Transcript_6247:50-421(+)
MTYIHQISKSDCLLLQASGNSDNLALIDSNGAVLKYFEGLVQERFQVRACVGGRDDRFVSAGGFDGKVKIWNRSQSNALEELVGHSSTVNCVSWSKSDIYKLASCSDDGTVRIWTALCCNKGV